jgi:hypothetical protein
VIRQFSQWDHCLHIHKDGQEEKSMKRLKTVAISCVLFSVLIVFLLSAAGAEARGVQKTGSASPSKANTCGVWSVVSSPNVGSSGDTNLAAVAAISPTDAWTVGNSVGSISAISATLTEHWNGSQWSIVSSPNVGSFSNTLLGVTSVASNNVWAVGFYINGSTHISQTLIEQWNGTSWSVVTSPNVGTSYNALNGVSAVSANDIWAVGYSQNPTSGAFSTLIEHWNGTQWSVVTSPNPGLSSNYLYSVKAVASGNVLAVGQALNKSGPDQPLVEQWNGSSWGVVSTPTTSNSSTLFGVAATTTNAWAVGNFLASNTTGTQNFAQQTGNAGHWNTVSIPSVGTLDNTLYGMVAVSDSNVWAVGTYTDASNGNNQTIIEQWNGTSWSIVTSQNPGSGNNILVGMAATSANDVWAVGGFDNGKGTKTLVEHFC